MMKYIFLGIILFTLYMSNPTTTEFTSFIADHVSTEMSNEGQSKEISDLAGGLSSMLAKASVVRKDFIFASTYFIDMSLLRDFGKDINDIHMLGIGGKFLPISK